MKHMTVMFLLASALLRGQPAVACDFCNCLLGINPYYSAQNSLALHFLYQQSEHAATLHTDEASTPDALLKLSGPLTANRVHHVVPGAAVATQEHRHTVELAYQHHVTDDLLLTLLVPFSYVTVHSSTDMSVMGNGDLTLTGKYIGLLSEGFGTRVTVLLGGGIQLPTGRTDAHDNTGALLDYRLQPGSGSVGLVLNATGFYQMQSWVFAADVFGKLNRENSSGNRLGHALSATIVANRDIIRENASLFAVVGSLGLRSEFTYRDVIAGTPDIHSGATVHYLTFGLEGAYDFLRLDLRSLVPLYQSRPDGGADESMRMMVGLRLLI